ncbi:DUF2793 domain-containing protein [Sphingomonas sp. CGMCC 1.13654]|uniref:DUF2793 domain-containing protein n=1 Tax=Sphingomonas chungangi TaxID=2683589 RepID=A0A838L396_9SPHN|nr:DUF2793 domain-containing protein [Sphingomonas chungangi]MBA2932992.1 DUF2793 domain-containing protein [Sphingomonas chungangi]MVW56612.1 DUF2793 domain-containing protein [Sphingomonas chungangi]
MTDATARFALPLIATGQAQKELFHNEALARIDALLLPVVESVLLDTPPAAPSPGQCWVIGDAPSGGWAGQGLSLAAWTEDGWRFVAPRAGMRVWSLSDSLGATFDGAAWTLGALHARNLIVGGVPVVGAQQSAIVDPSGGTAPDPQARAAISAILAALRAHGLIAV